MKSANKIGRHSAVVHIDETIRRQSHMYFRHPLLKSLGVVSFFTSIILPYWLAIKTEAWQLAADAFQSKDLFILVTLLIVGLVIHSANLAGYAFVYWLNHPFFEQFKDNDRPWPWQYDPEFKPKLIKAFKLVGFNNFVCSPIFAFSLIKLGLICPSTEKADIPSFWVYICQVIFMILCEDGSFYWGHRFLHQPALYPHIHKIHHEFYDTIAISSEYAHPVEFLCANLIPLVFGAVLLGSHCHHLSFLVFVMLRLFETVESHGGYDFPWAVTRLLPFSITSKYHNYHHLKNTGNYGSWLILWDSICGTNSYYYDDMLENDKSLKDYPTTSTEDKSK